MQRPGWDITSAMQLSPRALARTAGVFYLIIIALGLFAEVFVRGSILVSGDAVRTAENIVAREQIYRLGFVAGVVLAACNLPVALVFYELFKVVSRRIALLAVFFVLTATAIEGVNQLNHLAPLLALESDASLSVLTSDQLQALARLPLKLFGFGYALHLVFFGVYCMLVGYLLFVCAFFPRILGIMMLVGGMAYLTNSFALFLFPDVADQLFPYVLLPSAVAELSLALWLVTVGVDAARWEARARTVADAR